MTEREARDYVKWLETQCRETHLEDDQWFEYKLDKRRFIGGLKEEDPKKRKMHPFYAVVRSRAYAYLRLASKPTGANVYVQRTHKGEVYSQTLGQTPLEGDDVEERGVRLELNPMGQGDLMLIVELPRFRRYERSIVLGMNEVSDEILVTLQRENLFDYPREPLENGLGMQFIPVREDLELLASIWETRQSDFDAFVESMAEKVPAPKRADKSAGADYARFINRWAGSFTPPLPPDFADGGRALGDAYGHLCRGYP